LPTKRKKARIVRWYNGLHSIRRRVVVDRIAEIEASMSILLFVVGAIALAAGAAMIGFGIPINEFSF
jgi:hypothetical protein